MNYKHTVLMNCEDKKDIIWTKLDDYFNLRFMHEYKATDTLKEFRMKYKSELKVIAEITSDTEMENEIRLTIDALGEVSKELQMAFHNDGTTVNGGDESVEFLEKLFEIVFEHFI